MTGVMNGTVRSRDALVPAPIIPLVVGQHAEEAAMAFSRRNVLTEAPHATLDTLRRLDERMVAHLDGLAVASADAWPFCEAGLEDPTPGAVFVAAIRAIEDRSRERLDRIVSLAETAPALAAGLISAFEWVERRQLQGTVAALLGSPRGFARMIGIAACALHGVDPGLRSPKRLDDPDVAVRARLLRAAGELGNDDSMPSCTSAVRSEDDTCRFWGAWSAVLLGNRGVALETLTCTGLEPGPQRLPAFRLALQGMTMSASHRLLQKLAADPEQQRWVIVGSGIAGDPAYVPWLIGQMSNDCIARVAGEAFSLITGVDLTNGLDRPQPENVEAGPTEDADDASVEMDPDDGLPWPDRSKVEQWWTGNAATFEKGSRYFVGAPVTREHCINVLTNGYQRQRILAAHYLSLLNAGTPLFNTSAPASRQQTLLAAMS
jgi:uncharacterized protein (TIGR02270 family)